MNFKSIRRALQRYRPGQLAFMLLGIAMGSTLVWAYDGDPCDAIRILIAGVPFTVFAWIARSTLD